MKLWFVTGANSAFFPTLMILLQSFAEQIGESAIHVCDYGLTAGQREFLRRRGTLLERSPGLGPPMSPLREKAILHEYFRHSGLDATAADAVIWLDGDLTIVGCSLSDLEEVAAEMARSNIEIAASPMGTIAQFLAFLRQHTSGSGPFERSLTESAIDPAKPYYSTGLFICRSSSFLRLWAEIGLAVADHPVLDQNMFNVVVHRDARPVLGLDCDLWQTQGDALDRVRVAPDIASARSAPVLDGRPVRILHSTSASLRHLFVGRATFSVADLALEAGFKLLRSTPLLALQLELLGRFLAANRAELLELELCQRATPAVAGYSFSTSPANPSDAVPAGHLEQPRIS